jgi:hypothetical protein
MQAIRLFPFPGGFQHCGKVGVTFDDIGGLGRRLAASSLSAGASETPAPPAVIFQPSQGIIIHGSRKSTDR